MEDSAASTFDTICSVIRSTFPAARNVVLTPATVSDDVDGWDSLSYSVLIMNVEQAFHIELPVEKLYELDNVGALCALVDRLVAGGDIEHDS